MTTDSKSEPGLREKIMFHKVCLCWRGYKSDVCGTVCDGHAKWFKYRNVSFILWLKDITSTLRDFYTYTPCTVVLNIICSALFYSTAKSLFSPQESGGSQVSAHSSLYCWAHFMADLRKNLQKCRHIYPIPYVFTLAEGFSSFRKRKAQLYPKHFSTKSCI